MTATLDFSLTAPINATAFINFEDVDPTTAREIRASVENFYRDFPTVAPGLQSVSLDGEVFKALPYGYAMTQPVDASSAAPPYRITVNPHYYGLHTRRELVRDSRDDYERGFHGYEHPAGIIEHELGHVIDLCAGARQGLAYGASLKLFEDGYWSERDGMTISAYALQGGPMEAFGDAFANVRQGYASQQSPRVNQVVAMVTKAAAQ